MRETHVSTTATESNSTSRISGISKTSEDATTVKISTTVPSTRWNELLETSPHETPFHRYGALEVIAEHANATLHPLVGYQDGTPIGLFPVFDKSIGPVSTVFSPAPKLKVHYLGPAFLPSGDTDAATERRYRSFVTAAVDCLEDRFNPVYTHVRTGTGGVDPRPFHWQGFAVTPRYTYLVDLRDEPDELLDRFSSDARNNVRDGADCTITEGGRAAITSIVEQVRARHDAQDEPYPLTPAFLTDLYDALPSGTVRPYVVRRDGRFVGGMVALEDETTVYRWQGGAKPDADFPVNDLLDWHIIQDASDRGVQWYDLVGANNPRIAEYKAKFAPELAVYHSLTRSAPPMGAVARLYDRLQ